jgi:signal peptide peptidase SppA
MLPRLISEVFNGLWAMDRTIADSYIPVIASILKGDFQKNNIDFSAERQKNNFRFASFANGVYRLSEYGEAAPPENAPENSIAILNVTDVVTKYDMFCGPSGTKTKGNILQRADKNPNIKGVVLNIDSPGGEGYASLGLSQVIKSMVTPVISFVDDLTASAGYMIASNTQWIVANSELAQVGSIGTYITIADYREALKMLGISIEDIYATQSTEKNKPYRDAIDSNFKNTKLIQQSVDKFNERFLIMVAENRGNKLTNNSWNTGKLFFADEAMSVGIIDEIDTWENTINSFAKSLNLI